MDQTHTDTTGLPDTAVDTGPVLPPEQNELRNGTRVAFGHVIDGDTLDVIVGTRTPVTYNIRLKGLAAPECLKDSVQTDHFGRRFQCVADDEFYGLASREALVDIIAGKVGVVTCDDPLPTGWCPTDIYDRYLAYIEVDGMDVATEVAARGAGLSYTVFTTTKRAAICAAEYTAQDANMGMWASGTVDAVVRMMSQQTQSWYFAHHDQRCDAALGL